MESIFEDNVELDAVWVSVSGHIKELHKDYLVVEDENARCRIIDIIDAKVAQWAEA